MNAHDVKVICGPTASGKSAIAMWLAESRPITIISADSRQVYRGFDIGTAKPTREEMARVPHRGVDVVEPTQRYSAASWADAADGWIAEARERRREPVVVGGTGFYLRALFDGLFDEPDLDEARRLALQNELDGMGAAELRRWVERLDPARAHLGRSQLQRAIEIALLTGRSLSELHVSHARSPRHRARYLLVDPGEGLAARLEARIEGMIAGGWLEEVRRLASRVDDKAPAWQASGYRAMVRHVRGEITLDEAKAKVLVETRQYAKRQRTWFRHQLPADRVVRLEPGAPDWRARVERWWSEATTMENAR